MEKKVRKETSCTYCMGNINTNIAGAGGGIGIGMGMHKHSQTISKMKPKIRIIHIFAPEIIKTDAANFRELVQRLTGKPSPQDYSNKYNNNIINSTPPPPTTISSSPSTDIQMDHRNGFWGLGPSRERVKEGLICDVENSSSAGYSGGFSDLEGFPSEFGDFPLLPCDHATHHIMQASEEPLLS